MIQRLEVNTLKNILRGTAVISKTSWKLSALIYLFSFISLGICSPPNVIIVFTDDQGYGDLSCHGNPILKTPHIDKFAGESVRLDNFHVAPVCTPSRGELMTGLYALRNKACMVPAGRSLMKRGIPTMPAIFRNNNYKTGLFGKWHLGDTYPNRPMDRGFEKVVWHKGWGLASEIEYDNDYYRTRYYEEGKIKFSDRYCTNLWFDKAMEWMEEKGQKKEPFFTYIALNTPHSPYHAQKKDFELYKDKLKKNHSGHFYGMIHNIDENMGRLEKWLTEKKLKDNTIVIYMNDNGTVMDHIFNAGMRGRKGSNYDGGHRAICFIRWPQGNLGKSRKNNSTAHICDILPTLIDLCALKTSSKETFDGISLKPLLTQEGTMIKNRTVIVQYGNRKYPKKYDGCVVQDQWRLVGDKELYNVQKDPGQKDNIIGKHPVVAQKLKNHYEKFWNEIEPSIAIAEAVLVGSSQENPVILTCNNWLEVDVDNRTRVAKAIGPKRGGKWQIEVDQEGKYIVELARWPFHLQRDLTIAGPKATIGGKKLIEGIALPITSACLQLHDGTILKASPKGEKDKITFEVHLKKGRQTLQGWFQNANSKDLAGAFYGRVTRL